MRCVLFQWVRCGFCSLRNGSHGIDDNGTVSSAVRRQRGATRHERLDAHGRSELDGGPRSRPHRRQVAPLQARDLRRAPLTHVVAVTSGSDDGNESVAGEEDPGAAPDLLGSTADSPERWCRWPKDWDELAPSSLRSLPPRGASVSWPMTWRS